MGQDEKFDKKLGHIRCRGALLLYRKSVANGLIICHYYGEHKISVEHCWSRFSYVFFFLHNVKEQQKYM